MSVTQHPLDLNRNSHEEFLSPWDTDPPASLLNIEKVPSGLVGLVALATQGRWQELAARCRAEKTDTSASSSLLPPLLLKTFLVMALMKLSAWQEVQNQLINIKEPAESWPFALRWFQADLEAALGNTEQSMQRLYALLDICKNQEELAKTQGTSHVNDDEIQLGEKCWSRRRQTLLISLIARHVAAGQHRLALALVDSRLQDDPNDAIAWLQAVRIYALLGDLNTAHTCLEAARQAVATVPPSSTLSTAPSTLPPSPTETAKLLNVEIEKDSAMLLLLQGTSKQSPSSNSNTSSSSSTVEALKLYSSLSEKQHPATASLLNNEALCYAYSGNVVGSRRTLESAFKDHSLEMLSEVYVRNAATLLEVAPSGGYASTQAAKTALASWVAGIAPDDFDLACCKRPAGPVSGGMQSSSVAAAISGGSSSGASGGGGAGGA